MKPTSSLSFKEKRLNDKNSINDKSTLLHGVLLSVLWAFHIHQVMYKVTLHYRLFNISVDIHIVAQCITLLVYSWPVEY